MELKNSLSRPIFILGSPRSGTTLLRVLLSAHSKITIPHEYTLVENVINAFQNDEISHGSVLTFLESQYKISHFIDWNLEEKQLLEYFDKSIYSRRDIIENIYRCYLKTWSTNEARWGDKNISTLAYIEAIVEIFPDAKFIHIVRDGRDVASSLMNRKWNFYTFPKRKPHYINHIIGAMNTWNEALEILSSSRHHIPEENYIQIRYEDLLKESEGNLKQLCGFLNVDFEPEMLTYYQKEKSEQTISSKRLADTHENIHKPILKHNSEKFKTQFSESQIKIMETVSKENLNKYKYNLVYNGESPGFSVLMSSKLSYSFGYFFEQQLNTIKRVIKKIIK